MEETGTGSNGNKSRCWYSRTSTDSRTGKTQTVSVRVKSLKRISWYRRNASCELYRNEDLRIYRHTQTHTHTHKIEVKVTIFVARKKTRFAGVVFLSNMEQKAATAFLTRSQYYFFPPTKVIIKDPTYGRNTE